jgi:hypothetical protein
VFYIVNRSSLPIGVSIEAQPYSHATTGEPVCPLTWLRWPRSIVPASVIETDFPAERSEPGITDGTLNAAECTGRLSLPAQTAFVAWSSVSNNRVPFLAKVTLTMAERQTSYEGLDLARAFRKQSKTVYALQIENRR